MWHKRALNNLKGYFSILGFKIAVTVGFFMLTSLVFTSLLVNLFYRDYQREGLSDLVTLITSPHWWAGLIVTFLALMFFLSKLFILPLKKFELHIAELEQGKTKEPFVLKRNDEIGYLAKRFNSLHKYALNEIESRETHLSVLHDFTDSTSGVFDIPDLMDKFFTVLSTAVDYDYAGYVLTRHNHTEGRVYSVNPSGLPEDKAAERSAISSRLFSKAREVCPAFPSATEALEVMDVSGGKFRNSSVVLSPDKHAIDDVPIICYGEPVGVITIASSAPGGAEFIRDSKVFNAMLRHASTVMERLFKHIFAEEKKLTNILSSMSEGVYLIDKDGRAAAVNKKGFELISVYCPYSQECTKKGFEGGVEGCMHRHGAACEFSKLLAKVKNSGADFEGKVYTEEVRNNDGAVVQLSISNLKNDMGKNEGYVITAKDVTEDRLIQKRIMLSSKLAALGEMAAGIAHEVNNPLQVMMANVELIEGNVDEKGRRRVDYLKEGILRIKCIVRDLLIFAREQTTEQDEVDINSVIVKVVDILGRQLRVANVNVEMDLDNRRLVVKCNRNLFQQVIINLLQNAKDAIEESGIGSKVTIRSVLMPGGTVVVEASDDGPGIPENVVDRIFDPFFTTKDVGKGTGLGLSVSRRIIEGMGGVISVASAGGKGTRFTITLLQSRTHKTGKDVGAAKKETPAPDYTRLAGKSVLIVDDEDGVLKSVKDGISSSVAAVETASGGKEAYDALMDNDYDLILLDIKMPGMSGIELYRKLNETKPYLSQRVIFLTGDIENDATASFLKLTGCRYLSKPFGMKELLDVMCRYEMEMS
ncbi:MAG: response regulator [Deltaproteobacteria bacterium]|nr:response regulator [Deltaproteobacteria bacterium]